MLDKFDPDYPPKFGEGDIRSGNQAFKKEQLLETRRKLKPIKERFGSGIKDLVRVAIQFALAQSLNACVIPGFKNAHQVQSNAQGAGSPLNREEVAFIKQILRG